MILKFIKLELIISRKQKLDQYWITLFKIKLAMLMKLLKMAQYLSAFRWQSERMSWLNVCLYLRWRLRLGVGSTKKATKNKKNQLLWLSFVHKWIVPYHNLNPKC